MSTGSCFCYEATIAKEGNLEYLWPSGFHQERVCMKLSTRLMDLFGLVSGLGMLIVGYFLVGALLAKPVRTYSVYDIDIDDQTYPAVVLGGGTGGLTAGMYLSLANVKTLLCEGQAPGGLLNQSLSVRNWPGEMESPGAAITEKMRAQALKRGVIIASEKVIKVDFGSWPYLLTLAKTDDPTVTRTVRALTVIVGVGASSNYLSIPGEQEYWGRGVTNCAVCEGSLYRDKVVCVVGGGNSAMEEASYLSLIARKVYLFVRGDKLRATDNRKDEVLSRPNVEIVYNTSLTAVQGDGDKVTGVTVQDKKTGQTRTQSLDGVFLAIGFTPNTSLFTGKLALDAAGYIKLFKDQETSVPGVYAVGDAVDPIYKQAVTAAGDGCRAALQAQRFLTDAGYAAKTAVAESAKSTETAESLAAGEGDGTAVSSPVQRPLQLARTGEPYEVASGDELTALIAQNDCPVVVDFHATWCPPCKMIAPLYKKLAHKYEGKVLFLKVNIDHMPASASTYKVSGVPTFVFIKNGNTVAKLVGGGISQGEFSSQIDRLLG